MNTSRAGRGKHWRQ